MCESFRVKRGVGTLEELFEFIHAEALKKTRVTSSTFMKASDEYP
jgi:hypothetical protein